MQHLWEVIENGYEEPLESGSSTSWSPAKQKEYKVNLKKDATALSLIHQGVARQHIQESLE